ncbi:MaoC family dehydratase [Streptomyces sp. HB2AG]|uniref:MaoC family dehydratase n=1 Tax=Streptomyces sp. HB2AG TaxID=2983400 RepID=UPI0022AA44FA|nr:MaoC/PaaZ C-terminal domain-containing protein [Streptomyces sp. HB2AG]MCZ2528052.1 MaoC/PaaZ C-terminal domain-containing protein [Streptomyces sp. HB2AG]
MADRLRRTTTGAPGSPTGSTGRTGRPGTRELTAPPGLLGPYVRALVPKRGGGPAPERRMVLREAATDPRKLERYAEVCGFTRRDRLPATYPHLVAFPLAMSLMARRDFPLPMLGLVHIANRIEQLRPVGAGERLTHHVWTRQPRPHPRGTSFEVVAEADDGTATVWRSVSTYLSRSRRPPAPEPHTAVPGAEAPDTRDTDAGYPDAAAPDTAADTSAAAVVDEHWDVGGSAGRSYASVSGDRNPIHLHALTARAFGFPRAVAHGMWTKARCLAALETLLPDAHRVEVVFRAPVLLPAHVRFHASVRTAGPGADGTGTGIGTGTGTGTGTGWDFRLHGTGSGREHLRGTVTPLG